MKHPNCPKIGRFNCHFVFANNQKGLIKLKDLGLLRVLKQNLKKLEKIFNFKFDIDLILLEEKSLVIKEYGVAGFTPRKDLIYVYFDTRFKNLHQTIKKYLPPTLAHECHHAARWTEVGYGETLFEEIVTEGTATAFEVEYGGFVTLHAKALTKNKEGKMWHKIQPFLNSKDFDHNLWFFGGDKIPRWTGYHLGYKLAKKYLAKHPKLTAKDLAFVEAKGFLEFL